MTHEQLWRALDTLAAEKGLSPSGLARLAGLDPTSFNRSKRRGPNGPRWPGTDSLARVLSASGIDLAAFSTLVSGGRVLSSGRAARTVPVLLFSGLDGVPPGRAEIDAAPSRMAAPADAIEGGYLVRVDREECEPLLRRGDLLFLMPDATIAPGDRVLVFNGERVAAALAGAHFPRRAGDANARDAQARVLRTGAPVSHRINWIGC